MRRENGHGLELQITCGLNLAWTCTFSNHMPSITDRYKSPIYVSTIGNYCTLTIRVSSPRVNLTVVHIGSRPMSNG